MNNSVANIEFSSERAHDLCIVSDSYQSWVPDVKAKIRRANNEDYGTFIVACALLEDAIPKEHKTSIEKQIKLVKHEKLEFKNYQYRKKEKQKSCIVLSCIFGFLGFLLSLWMFSSTNFSYAFGFDRIPNCLYLSGYGTILFGIVGCVSIGYIVATCSMLSKYSKYLCFVLSSVFGFVCSFICSAIPPLSLLFAWYAYHLSVYLHPKYTKDLQYHDIYKKLHGKRVFATNPRAPEYIKNALRLAGIYQTSDDYIKDIALQTLSRKQTDYGAFLAYEAFLQDYHDNINRESIFKSIYGEEQKESENNENSHMPFRHIWKRSKVVVTFFGIMSAILCAAFFSVFVVLINDAITVKTSLPDYFVSVFICCICLVLSILIGIRSSIRVRSIDGLNTIRKCIIVSCRSSWFSAWTNIIFVATIFIIFLS